MSGKLTLAGILLSAMILGLTACADSADSKMKPVDDNGVPLDQGKAECKAQAKAQAAELAKGSITNGIADDLYADCLSRRGYFGH